MPRRLPASLAIGLLMALIAAIGPGTSSIAPAQTSGGTWQSAMVWQPTLADAGNALADLVNQIDAVCSVDVDPVVATAGSGPEGAVYAFAITWSCPANASENPSATWQSAMIWQPTLADAGNALASLVNEIDASCSVDVDTVVAANGTGPEGPVYAFAVTWAC